MKSHPCGHPSCKAGASEREEMVAMISHAYETQDWMGERSTAEVIADALLEAGYTKRATLSTANPFHQTADFGDDND